MTAPTAKPILPTHGNRIQNVVDSLITPLLHPAVYFFAVIWGVAALVLLVTGNPLNVVFGLVQMLGISVFMLLTRGITPTANEEDESKVERVSLGRLAVQLALIFAVIAVTAYSSLAWHGFAYASAIPVWTPVLNWIGDWGSQFLSVEMVGDPVLAVVNPVAYALIPLAGLLLLGVAPRHLGMRGGRRTWWVILLWCSVGLILWAIALFSGQLSLNTLRRWMVANLLQNGFSEEFLFRGALQTRLKLILSTPWALVTQALIFAIWHLGAGASLMDGDIWLGVAANIVAIAPFGLAYGYIFQRTRNLIACSVVHAGLNSMF